LFYPIDLVKKSPYLENSLYNEFNNLISNQLINFNYEIYLELNDILFDDLDINAIILSQEFLICNIIKQINYNSNISNSLINYLFFNLNLFKGEYLNCSLNY
jgi:hypothetical protein